MKPEPLKNKKVPITELNPKAEIGYLVNINYYSEHSIKSAVQGLLKAIEDARTAEGNPEECSLCQNFFDYYDDVYFWEKKPVCLECLIKKWFPDVF